MVLTAAGFFAYLFGAAAIEWLRNPRGLRALAREENSSPAGCLVTGLMCASFLVFIAGLSGAYLGYEPQVFGIRIWLAGVGAMSVLWVLRLFVR